MYLIHILSIYAYICTCTYMCTYTYIFICKYTCMHIHACIQNTHACVCIFYIYLSPFLVGEKNIAYFVKKLSKSLLLNFAAHLNLNTIKFSMLFSCEHPQNPYIVLQCPFLYISWVYHDLWYNNEPRSP